MSDNRTTPAKKVKDKPFALRLGGMKMHLMQLAFDDERSTTRQICLILHNHLKVNDPTYKYKTLKDALAGENNGKS